MRKGPCRRAAALGAVLALCAALGIASCEDDSTDPGTGDGLSDLSIQVLEGYISANLQPVVPPDPILCTLTLRIVNGSGTDPYSGLFIPSAEVFLSENSIELGTIRFQSDWDGAIGAGAIDTVVVTKIQERAEIFDPPCGKRVYLRVRIAKTAVQWRTFSTPAYVFSCPVLSAKSD
jgi:hypothetical protein